MALNTIPKIPVEMAGDNGQTIAILPGSTVTSTEPIDNILDRQWARQAFLMSDAAIADADDIRNRYWSSAHAKFTDTRMGGSIGINAKPQFTRYADVRVAGRMKSRNKVSPSMVTGNHGLGRYYSEAIDDPSQTIYMRMGVPQFNGLMTFFKNAFDADAISLARTGRSTGAIYKAAQAVGSVLSFYAAPGFAMALLAGRALNWLFATPVGKYYTLKPTMVPYWMAVSQIVNNLMVNRGLIPKIMDSYLGVGNNASQAERPGGAVKVDYGMIEALSYIYPDIFPNTNGINNTFVDITAIALRAQRMANRLMAAEFDELNVASATDYTGYVKKERNGYDAIPHRTYMSNDNGKATMAAMIDRYFRFSYFFGEKDKPKAELDPRAGDPEQATSPEKLSFAKQYAEYLDAEYRDGSQFAIFKVEHTGTVSENFSNASAESEISSKLNSISSNVKQARFTMADGNIIGGAVGAMAGGVVDAAKDLVTGALDGLTFGISNLLMGLAGSGYIDIPKHWQSSNVSMNKSTYTMKLISPYGNPLSQLQNIYVPLAMILAASLPRAVGKAAYTSPFLCELYDRGRCQTRLGMVESLNIQRGTSNLPFDTHGNALAIDVSFSVVDLSSIMHMPVPDGSIIGFDAANDPDSLFMDYLAVLAGQDLYSQIYPSTKAKLKLAKTLAATGRLVSPAAWAMTTSDLSRKIGVGYLIESVVRGTSNNSAILGN